MDNDTVPRYIPDINEENIKYITDKYSLNNCSLANELQYRFRDAQNKMSKIIYSMILADLKNAADNGVHKFTVSFRHWGETAKTPGVTYKQRYNPNFNGIDNIFNMLTLAGINLDVIKTDGRMGPIHYVYFDLDPTAAVANIS